MKNLIIGFILGILFSIAVSVTVTAIAENTGTQRSLEYILNKMWDPNTNTLDFKGV
jgi:hypothetical protein